MMRISALITVGLMAAATVGQSENLTLEQLLDQDDTPRLETYKTVDGKELRLHVYTPEGHKQTDKRPAILVIHGGGWGNPGPFHVAHLCRYLAGRGMVAVNVEYRLVGKDTDVRIADCMADCADALAYVRKQAGTLGIDPSRIAVAGDSAGGHLAAALALAMGTKAPANAAILYNPVLDLADTAWMAQHQGVAALPDSPPDETWQDRAKRVSPTAFVGPDLPPMLLIHGVKDACVPIKQADAFARQVQKFKNPIQYERMPDWNHAFIVPNYGTEPQIVKTLQLTDTFLTSLGYLAGEPTIQPRWQPTAYYPLFDAQKQEGPHLKVRSFDFHDYPFLDGQWQGILTDSDNNTWFAISSHSGIHHGQVFRYSAEHDRVDHIADLGQVVGEKMLDLADGVPEGKIHSNMYEDGDLIYCATTDAHRLHDEFYTGGYWLTINRKTGKITPLARSITEDGLLCAGYDHKNKLMYGHTNVKGLLTCFDPATGKEEILGFPWEGSKRPWPRGLVLMFAPNGKIYGGRPPRCSFWEYDPTTKTFRTFRPDMPVPDEIKQEPENTEKLEQWEQSAMHMATWNEQDGCFYFVRSFDEMLMRFYPPATGRKARVEALRTLRPTGLERLWGNRPAACTLVMHDRTVYYTPGTGWGGIAHLVGYNVDTGTYTDHGQIVASGNRQVAEVHSMSVGKDGTLYMVAFVYSVEAVDPVREYGQRGKYPFHPRLLIVNPED